MLNMQPQNQGFIIVDVQNDFCEGGSLAISQASQIIPKINEIKRKFKNVFLTTDWHPSDHVSFYTNHENKEPFTNIIIDDKIQELWPPHCIQNSKGAEFHPDLNVEESDIIIRKGFDTQVDSYSAFGNIRSQTTLNQKLQELQIKRVYVVGLAMDFCVIQTALSAAKLGYETYILEDCTKSINPSKIQELIKNEVEANLSDTNKSNLKIIQSSDL